MLKPQIKMTSLDISPEPRVHRWATNEYYK
jgi:hypothetical protein